jgi:hypothetical protein
MKSASKKRAPTIVNLTVKRRYLTEREVERLMDCARKHGIATTVTSYAPTGSATMRNGPHGFHRKTCRQAPGCAAGCIPLSANVLGGRRLPAAMMAVSHFRSLRWALAAERQECHRLAMASC